MNSDGRDATPPRKLPILLSDKQRWCAGLFGAASGGGGATATFLTSNQAGSTALLLAGGLGLLMALTGRVPDRIGREGIVHDRDDAAANVLTEVLGDPEVPTDLKTQIADAIKEEFERRTAQPKESNSSPSPETTPSERRLQLRADAVRFENLCLALVNDALEPVNAEGRELGAYRSDHVREVDGWIGPTNDVHAAHIALEFKFTASINKMFQTAIKDAVGRIAMSGIPAALVIIGSPEGEARPKAPTVLIDGPVHVRVLEVSTLRLAEDPAYMPTVVNRLSAAILSLEAARKPL